jgi:hypothetical protein
MSLLNCAEIQKKHYTDANTAGSFDILNLFTHLFDQHF